MCGRYFRRSDKQRIADAFALSDLPDTILEAAPSFNIAPTTRQPVIINDRETGKRTLEVMRWGMIPYWTKGDPKKLGISTINAKAETLLDKALWKQPFLRRRCLVPADGYYEWKKLDAKNKQPFAFAMKREGPFAFAGLWDRWKAPSGEVVDSFAIITTEANDTGEHVHDRMPLILHSADYDRWLAESSPEQPPTDLLRTTPSDEMKHWPVSKDVGNARNDSPALADPVDLPADDQGCAAVPAGEGAGKTLFD